MNFAADAREMYCMELGRCAQRLHKHADDGFLDVFPIERKIGFFHLYIYAYKKIIYYINIILYSSIFYKRAFFASDINFNYDNTSLRELLESEVFIF